VPVYALATRPIEQRDFTEGEATRLWHQLLTDGMHTAASAKEVLAWLETNPMSSSLNQNSHTYI
jgi:hypothetical protein